MSDKRYDDNVQVPISEPRRQPHPIELTVFASGAAAVLAVGIATLIERPVTELWRWLIIAALIPVTVLLLRCLAPLLVDFLEVLSRRDLSGDGVIGRPHPVLVNPAQGQAEARRQTEAQYRGEFEEFVRGCASDTSMRRWEGKGMSRAKYNEFRDVLLGAGYAVWNSTDQRQGWRLVKAPEHIIRELWRA